jgi:hypothetical protein
LVDWNVRFGGTGSAAFLAPRGAQRVVRTLPARQRIDDYITTHIGRILQAFKDFPVKTRSLMVVTGAVRSAGWACGLTSQDVREKSRDVEVDGVQLIAKYQNVQTSAVCNVLLLCACWGVTLSVETVEQGIRASGRAVRSRETGIRPHHPT